MPLPVSPPDQDVDRSTGQFEDLPAQVFHGPRNADQLALDTALVGHLPTQLAVLADQAALVQGTPYAVEQALGGEGFFDEVIGALAQCLHRHGHVAMASNEDHRQVAVDLQQLVEQLQAISAGHAHIADDDAGEVAVDQSQGFGRTGAGTYVATGQLQPLLYRLANRRFVVDHYDLSAHGTSS